MIKASSSSSVAQTEFEASSIYTSDDGKGIKVKNKALHFLYHIVSSKLSEKTHKAELIFHIIGLLQFLALSLKM